MEITWKSIQCDDFPKLKPPLREDFPLQPLITDHINYEKQHDVK